MARHSYASKGYLSDTKTIYYFQIKIGHTGNQLILQGLRATMFLASLLELLLYKSSTFKHFKYVTIVE